MKTCPECNGDGVIEKGTDDEEQCPTCGGSGFVPDDDDDDDDVTRTASSSANPTMSSRCPLWVSNGHDRRFRRTSAFPPKADLGLRT